MELLGPLVALSAQSASMLAFLTTCIRDHLSTVLRQYRVPRVEIVLADLGESLLQVRSINFVPPFPS